MKERSAKPGPWGDADSVWRAVEGLELDEVQHGIAAADVAMFGQSVSHKFLNLYKAGCLNEKEIDQIRENGLSD